MRLPFRWAGFATRCVQLPQGDEQPRRHLPEREHVLVAVERIALLERGHHAVEPVVEDRGLPIQLLDHRW